MMRSADVRAKAERLAAGLMTGTSMDGLDVALCRLRCGPALAVELLRFATVPLPAALRADLAPARLADVAALARTHQRLGAFFAAALAEVAAGHGPLDLIGSHGQTVYHEHGVTTLQLGAPAPLAVRFGCPVVHDFRAQDIAAGGCGAPLVPYVDQLLLGGRGQALLAVNIGGIANLTVLPASAANADPDSATAVLGMDCGPGNMILDALARRYSDGRLAADFDGALAARGRVRQDWLERLCAHPFLAAPPPKSAGREQFGEDFAARLLAWAAPRSDQDWCDLLATVTELTVHGIASCYARFVAPRQPVDTVVVSGGGARNPELMRRLALRLAPLPLLASDAYGLPVDAKEAIAFAVLASERIDERPANLPAVTGARRRVLLGSICEA